MTGIMASATWLQVVANMFHGIILWVCRICLLMHFSFFQSCAGYFRDCLRSYNGLLHVFTCANVLFAIVWVFKTAHKRRQKNMTAAEDLDNGDVGVAILTPLNNNPTSNGHWNLLERVRACARAFFLLEFRVSFLLLSIVARWLR